MYEDPQSTSHRHTYSTPRKGGVYVRISEWHTHVVTIHKIRARVALEDITTETQNYIFPSHIEKNWYRTYNCGVLFWLRNSALALPIRRWSLGSLQSANWWSPSQLKQLCFGLRHTVTQHTLPEVYITNHESRKSEHSNRLHITR